jgi:hypothetical protein
MSLESVSMESFAPLQGSGFGLQHGHDTLELQLEGVRALSGGFKRQGFALLFRGPVAPLLAQETYPITHPNLGTLEIFIVPVGLEPSGALYEAIFT